MNSGAAVCALLDAMDRASIRYMVTGGLVANAYGIPRSTDDADLVVQFDESGVERLAGELPEGLVLVDQISFEMITGSRRIVVSVDGSPFSIELFFLGLDPHHLQRFERRAWRYLPDLEREAWIATPEDMIIQKVRWNRDKDRDDTRNILAVQGDTLDFGYLERWCRVHGTAERLDELRRSIPPV